MIKIDYFVCTFPCRFLCLIFFPYKECEPFVFCIGDNSIYSIRKICNIISLPKKLWNLKFKNNYFLCAIKYFLVTTQTILNTLNLNKCITHYEYIFIEIYSESGGSCKIMHIHVMYYYQWIVYLINKFKSTL